MVHINVFNRFTRGASWILILYLSFALSGCSFRPDVLSPEEARIMQTRELNGTPEEIARAVVVVLQEMHYTLGNVDMNLGVITAERSSERKLAPISKEPVSESEIDDGVKTFFIVAGIVLVVGFIAALIFGGNDDDDDDDEEYEYGNRHRSSRWSRRHSHHETSTVFVDSGNSGPASYLYTMTISLEEIVPLQTRVRVTVQGEHYDGPAVSESGPIQAQEFYTDFFNRLQIALNQ
ncbi:MAG: hypothetical protein K9N35_07650 [Candidatus Marinimicrobia bacterium]|nr:hypothetical protein [Candidatus Neomarinimicrobiota bacterium]